MTAVRQAVGPSMHIMVDANQSMTLAQARQRAEALQSVGLYWLEEPMPADDVAAHRALAQSTTIPIAVGRAFTRRLSSSSTFTRKQPVSFRLMLPGLGDYPVAQGRAPCRDLQRDGVPAFPDGNPRLSRSGHR